MIVRRSLWAIFAAGLVACGGGGRAADGDGDRASSDDRAFDMLDAPGWGGLPGTAAAGGQGGDLGLGGEAGEGNGTAGADPADGGSGTAPGTGGDVGGAGGEGDSPGSDGEGGNAGAGQSGADANGGGSGAQSAEGGSGNSSTGGDSLGVGVGGVAGVGGTSAGETGGVAISGGAPGIDGAGGAGGIVIAGGAAGTDSGLGTGGQAGGGGAGGMCAPGTVFSSSNPLCHDPCADLDSDLDGLNDCQDLCPYDSAKATPGTCGCGHADTDTDTDSVPDCVDPCPTDPTRSSVGPCGAGPAHVDLTWMTVANIYAEAGPVNFIIDGFISRIPKSNFYGGTGGLEYTYSPIVPDVTAVGQVLAALGGATKVNLLLTGHSHFDHSLDTATWSSLTGAPIIGSKTSCYQAIAQGIPAARCTEVVGGERLTLSPGVTMRVIRWNHSGDSSTNPEQHDPVELPAVPIPDASTGGLRAGVSEDFPNGGGGRAFLFTIDGADGPYSWFFINSAGPVDLDVPIVIDGVDYGAPLENLKAAMVDAKLTGVDLWVGAGGAPVAQLVLPIVNPKAYLPVHWDNFYAAFLSSPGTYSDRSLATTLSAQGVNLITPVQVMDKWRLDRTGVHAVPNTAVKQALNFQ